MKALRIGFALGMGLLGGVLLAQSEADFPGWMAQVAKGSGALKGAVASKDAKAVAAEAKNFETIFKNVEAVFTKMNIADGAAQAKAVHTAAAAAAKAAGMKVEKKAVKATKPAVKKAAPAKKPSAKKPAAKK